MFAQFRYVPQPQLDGAGHLANEGDTSGGQLPWPWSGSHSEFPGVSDDHRRSQHQVPDLLDHHDAMIGSLYL